jgi:hypothetical protein
MNEINQDPSNLQALTERIQVVKRAHEAELLCKANVVGVGVGYRRQAGEATSNLALVVMVTNKLPAALLAEADRIPSMIDGVPVDVQEVGKIMAH